MSPVIWIDDPRKPHRSCPGAGYRDADIPMSVQAMKGGAIESAGKQSICA